MGLLTRAPHKCRGQAQHDPSKVPSKIPSSLAGTELHYWTTELKPKHLRPQGWPKRCNAKAFDPYRLGVRCAGGGGQSAQTVAKTNAINDSANWTGLFLSCPWVGPLVQG